jgi:hypothetical protein
VAQHRAKKSGEAAAKGVARVAAKIGGSGGAEMWRRWRARENENSAASASRQWLQNIKNEEKSRLEANGSAKA